MSHLDFSKDDLIDSTSTSSPQNEPTPTIPVQTRALNTRGAVYSSARCKNRKPTRPISTLDELVPESIPVPSSLYTRSPNFYFSDLIEVGISDVRVPSECVSLTIIPQVHLAGRYGATYRVPAPILQQPPPLHVIVDEKPIEIGLPPFLLQDVSPTQMEAFLDMADSR